MSRPAIPYILATAGHVDHGKSALVIALTGKDPDRLPAEKARGITIDLGFASFTLAGKNADYEIGVIDVPGHEDFVKNMVAGVGSIDAALLVIAADDGWMPQTAEHVQILEFLGVRRAVVALSKADLAPDINAVRNSIAERLRATAFAEAPIIPTSTVTGAGIDALRQALAVMFAKTSPQVDAGKPRLAVDRAFALKGVGTIVTGTLTGGSLHRGQAVVVQLAQTANRVRGLQTHGRAIEIASSGMRVAINLPDISVAAENVAGTPGAVARGDVVTIRSVGTPGKTLDAQLTCAAGDLAIKNGANIWLHHGSAAIPARIRFFDRQSLHPGDKALARLGCARPLLALVGDRFILRDGSQRHTIAGGIVLDPAPPIARRRSSARDAQKQLLTARAAAPADSMVYIASLLARDCVAAIDDLFRYCMFPQAALDEAVAALLVKAVIARAGAMIADAGWWNGALQQIRDAVAAFHEQHPDRPGLPLPEVRAMIARSLPRRASVHTPAICDAMLVALARDGFEQSAGHLRRTGHALKLPPHLESAAKTLRQKLSELPFDPPSRKTLTPTNAAIVALKFLIAHGEAVEISSDVVLSAEAYQRAIAVVRKHIQSHGPATVSALKKSLESSRRVMVPLVEKMDRDGVTRRVGDARALR